MLLFNFFIVFSFSSFLEMIMYDNKYKTKENEIVNQE